LVNSSAHAIPKAHMGADDWAIHIEKARGVNKSLDMMLQTLAIKSNRS
jgi:hypothetical protein